MTCLSYGSGMSPPFSVFFVCVHRRVDFVGKKPWKNWSDSKNPSLIGKENRCHPLRQKLFVVRFRVFRGQLKKRAQCNREYFLEGKLRVLDNKKRLGSTGDYLDRYVFLCDGIILVCKQHSTKKGSNSQVCKSLMFFPNGYFRTVSFASLVWISSPWKASHSSGRRFGSGRFRVRRAHIRISTQRSAKSHF